ncbi:MAG: four helix bundle protein [Bacteroidota bacterium]
MSKINSFEDLLVWQKAINIAVEVYKLTSKFPKEEIFGMTSQLRRASTSISLNISEGSVKSTATFILQLGHARGSAGELLSGFILSQKLGFLTQNELSKMRALIEEESKMINGLMTAIKNKNK